MFKTKEQYWLNVDHAKFCNLEYNKVLCFLMSAVNQYNKWQLKFQYCVCLRNATGTSVK